MSKSKKRKAKIINQQLEKELQAMKQQCNDLLEMNKNLRYKANQLENGWNAMVQENSTLKGKMKVIKSVIKS